LNLATQKTIQTACALALAGVVDHAAADTVVLTNGDTLSGDIVQSDDRGVILKHSVLGTVALDAKRISKIIRDADTPQATDGTKSAEAPAAPDPTPTPKPTPEPQPKPATDFAADAKAVQQRATEAAVEDRSFWQRFREDWNSKLTLGLNGSAGPTDRKNYRVQFATGFEDGRDRWKFDTSWFYATADGDKVQNQTQTNFTKDWLQKDAPWFFFVKGQHRFDENRSWENRTSAFGGGGYTIAKTDDVEVNTRLGFGGTYEFGSVNEFTPEALFGGSVIKWNISERAAVSGETIYYPSLEDAANFRIESKLVWTYKLDMADGLALKLGLENEYDSATPNEDANNDLRYYGAIVLSF
jgi:hypothetical protein